MAFTLSLDTLNVSCVRCVPSSSAAPFVKVTVRTGLIHEESEPVSRSVMVLPAFDVNCAMSLACMWPVKM